MGTVSIAPERLDLVLGTSTIYACNFRREQNEQGEEGKRRRRGRGLVLSSSSMCIRPSKKTKKQGADFSEQSVCP